MSTLQQPSGIQTTGGLEGVVDAAELQQIHRVLRDTFDRGVTRPLAWRRQQLTQLLMLFRDNEKSIIEALEADLGRPQPEGWFADFYMCVAEIEGALKNLRKWTDPRRVSGNLFTFPSRNYIYRDPLGAVLIISPWNYPISLALVPLVGAIAAGNSALVKPSEVAVRSANLVHRLIDQYMDKSAIRVVNGGAHQTTALLELRWDMIFYTGSGAVGRIVAAAAAKHLTPTVLELGGKSPVYVSDQCNLDVAARRIVHGKFNNSAQTCVAPDYVLVHERVKEPWLAKVKETIRTFYGDNPRDSSSYGRIVNERHTERLSKLLAVPAGASAPKTFVGGETDVAARYVAPTVLIDVEPSHAVMQDEIFGPILPVLTVKSREEAVRYVNSHDKPLALYVFSDDKSEVRWVLENSTAGGVAVNDTIMHLVNHHLPFGGVGPSGHGNYHGEASVRAFSHEKSVLWRPASGVTDVPQRYPPYTERKFAFLKWIARVQHWVSRS